LFIIGVTFTILISLVAFQYIYVANRRKEGFLNTVIDTPDSSSTIPRPEGTSTIPNTMPGSTYVNRTDTIASIKDIQELNAIIKTYNSIYDINAEKASKNTEYAYLKSNSDNYLNSSQTQIDSGIITYKYKFIKDLLKRYVNATRVIRQYPSMEKTESTTVTTNITIDDLKDTIERAKTEKSNIENMRTPSSDLKGRILNLDKVIQELQDIIGKIQRGSMKIEDAPFSKRELKQFLENKSASPPRPDTKSKKKSIPKIVSQDKSSKDLFKAVRDLSWEIKLGYDPKVTLHRKTMERLEQINKEIKKGDLPKKVLESKLLELQILKQQCETNNRRNLASSDTVILANNQNTGNYEKIDDVEGYATQIDRAYQPLIRNVKQASASNDWRSRPGYEPTDNIISQRAKASSYDSDSVSSVDYFKRALFLCNQIRDSELGDPVDFGCILNKEDVSPEYSWRGNYKMVCSRLGNTWGSWYPEMFGCPKSEVSTSMVPNKKVDM
jgi:hypothetical protein